jgi:hypothetical protein
VAGALAAGGRMVVLAAPAPFRGGRAGVRVLQVV